MREAGAGGQPLVELDGAGTLVRRFVPGPGGLAPAVIGDTQWRYPLTDRRGSVLLLTDGAGTVLGRGRGTPAAGSPFGYTGHRFDPETGLYATPTRHYSPALGRWMQLDPIGIKDGLNRFEFVGNDPINFVDVTGEQRRRTTEPPSGPPQDPTILPTLTRIERRILAMDPTYRRPPVLGSLNSRDVEIAQQNLRD